MSRASRFAKTRLVVGAAVIDAMKEMSLACPKMDRAQRQSLEAARAELGGGRGSR